jgi:hypothetical protein
MIKITGLISALLLTVLLGTAASYEEIKVVNGGTVSGRVIFKGKIPAGTNIPVVKNREFCGKSVWDPVLVVNPSNGGLKNTVVYLKSVKRGKPLPKNQFIDAFKCLFVPHTAVLMRNQPVMFHNNDTVFHNVHVFDDHGRTLLNLALPSFDAVATARVKTTGVVRIQCDSHVHMNGWALSLEHPYFSVTDDSGRYKITGVPPGEYTLVAWHEGYHMANRPDFEASLKNFNDGSLVRPLYDRPFEISRPVEVKTNGVNKEDFVLEAR